MPSKNWGGARGGSGRKPICISDKEKKNLIKAAKEASKRTGKTVWDILMMHIYNGKDQPRVSVAAIKVFQDAVIAKQSHETKEIYNYSPAILPVLEDDPSRIDMAKAAQSPVH